jgi:hypothetical protein
MSSFPWPVTDDQLLLTQSLEDVLAAVGPRNETDEARIGEVAKRLVVEAYQFGVRDRTTISEYALREMLRAGLVP